MQRVKMQFRIAVWKSDNGEWSGSIRDIDGVEMYGTACTLQELLDDLHEWVMSRFGTEEKKC